MVKLEIKHPNLFLGKIKMNTDIIYNYVLRCRKLICNTKFIKNAKIFINKSENLIN